MGVRPIAALGLAVLALASLEGCARLRTGAEVGFAEAARIDRGKDVFRRECAPCHGGPGEASPREGAPPVDALARRYSAPGLVRELEAIAEVGHYGMPALTLTARDRANVASYVARLGGRDRRR